MNSPRVKPRIKERLIPEVTITMGTKENSSRNNSMKTSSIMAEFQAKLYESTIEAARDFSVIYREDQKKEASGQNPETENHQETR